MLVRIRRSSVFGQISPVVVYKLVKCSRWPAGDFFHPIGENGLFLKSRQVVQHNHHQNQHNRDFFSPFGQLITSRPTFPVAPVMNTFFMDGCLSILHFQQNSQLRLGHPRSVWIAIEQKQETSQRRQHPVRLRNRFGIHIHLPKIAVDGDTGRVADLHGAAHGFAACVRIIVCPEAL